MPAALVVQLILQFGLPAARQILELVNSKGEPTLDEWIRTLDSVQVNANKFLERTKDLETQNTKEPSAQTI